MPPAHPSSEPIAVVGSACRFAGSASSPSKLWSLLREPRDLHRVIPDSRFVNEAFYHPDGQYHGHTNVRHAYLVDQDPSTFDAPFFGIKPAEARAMDPQQRFLMEIVYEAIESAGFPISDLKGSDTAVYVGTMFDDYASLLLRDLQDMPTYYATGTGRSILANRISYFFDWHGPSISVDTACSSSLVAVHMAVQSLRSGESRTALACGTNLILGPESFIVESKLGMLSPDGLGRMWDQGANGYARGDGVAAIVLKTLRSALEDGDHIECVIRETGLNTDGATPGGLTMPSATAQEALIRRTYSRAGLDPAVACDQPQYFEAHGTGTPAGDPREAEAVYNVFGAVRSNEVPPLFVGSIKTVLGHTEGTAGIAAILKASLALQHALIPPNLLFNRLSDRVAPFYRNIEISRTSRPWPDSTSGIRRASVNSFGFGGANAHAIMENYDPKPLLRVKDAREPRLFTPFVFSAASETALRSMLSDYLTFLQDESPDVDPEDLAWVLRKRRSVLQWRISFSATSVESLRDKVRASLGDKTTTMGIKAPLFGGVQLLGIFTGQGAQYARMGAELIESSEVARGIIKKLESYLAEIPEQERPSWSLEDELLAGPSTSRMHEAPISQPLCTAIQILLVDLLRLSGVQFDAVVGHSSGEIAAAYSAGLLSARDAMYVAYFRGLHAERSGRGAMLAVGTSSEDAAELCADRMFAGRVVLAAVNSPSSVTISGDEQAIAELELVLDDEKKFHRRLRVDKAYHSPQMLACVEPYMTSLRRCGVALQTPGADRVAWYSSVHDVTVDVSTPGLNDTYWADNMTRPVLFYQAIERAVAAHPSCRVLEIGPHPALQGPASQTIQQALGKDVSYSGFLSRGMDAMEASSIALGYLWSQLGGTRVDLDNYQKAITAEHDRAFRVIKGLPTYPWDHRVQYWHESRSSRQMRLSKRRVHPLLGDLSPDSAPHHIIWKNLIRISEMKWLLGHQVQSQVVFPMAGYLSTAFEASRLLAEDIGAGDNVRLIEIHNFIIRQAVVLDQEDRGVEVLISMADISRKQPDRIRARFTYSAAVSSSQNAQGLTLAAIGDVEIHLGSPDPSLLPKRKPSTPHMIEVEPERFYAALHDLGYHFSDRFRSLHTLSRKNGKASCLVKMESINDDQYRLLFVHPADLDGALQSVILAHSYPYDEQLRTLHLPTSIKRIRVNPALCDAGGRREDEIVSVDARIVPREVGQRGVIGHVDVYTNASTHAAIQVQAGAYIPLGDATPEQDRRVFSNVKWVYSRPDGFQAASGIELTEGHRASERMLERIATFYLRKMDRDLPNDHPKRTKFPTSRYLNFARHITSLVEAGKHRLAERSWLEDSLDDILQASKPFAHLPDVEIMHLVGRQMPRVLRGETTMLEAFRADDNDILDRYYTGAFGLEETGRWVARSVKQIVERYPHMKILELGAGTGGATKAIFDEIGSSFTSYTYTDISAAFFKTASSVFSRQSDHMHFKTLDAERDPVEQGFRAGSYDMVVAYFVIHATSDIRRCLCNIRKLLRPGGFLVVGEGLEDGSFSVASSGFIFGTLPGWWLGSEAERTLTPHVSAGEWDLMLKSTGFSGADSTPPDAFRELFHVFPFVSQAVDEQVEYLRRPLTLPPSWSVPRISKLIIVGGQTRRTSHLVKGLKAIFDRGELAASIYTFATLLDVDQSLVDNDILVISMSELDHPVFKNITPQSFEALKSMFVAGKTLLWVTSGRLESEPYSNMTVGFGRCATSENLDLRLQQLDIADPETISPESIAEVLLRFQVSKYLRDDVLWSVEPEIVIGANRHHLLARLMPIPELNDRYNSASRTIVHERDATASPTVFQSSPDGYVIRELSGYETVRSGTRKDTIELRVTHAVISALKTPLSQKFLVYGVDAKTNETWLALVPSLASVLMVSVECAVAIPGARHKSFSVPEFLRSAAAHLIAAAILEAVHAGETILVHNAQAAVAKVISKQAGLQGVHVVFTTDLADDLDEMVPDIWIKLPRNASQDDVGDLLQCADLAAFVGLSREGNLIASDTEATLISVLGQHFGRALTIMTSNTLYSPVGCERLAPSSASVLANLLGKCLESALEDLQAGGQREPVKLFALASLASGEAHAADSISIVEWTPGSLVPVQVARLDATPMFKGASTYWIVGMTGALGLSLADWMISKGAKQVVLTSRAPKISPEWVASHDRRGATVTVLACDVTDEAALKAVHQKICETLPPIAGVIQGAMVLRDVSLRNMTFEQLTDVVRPKVDGSLYLDRIFNDVDLDFFVLVSSINCVIGNWGQANYAAANTFMCALAANRRKRGLRAATVNGGAIVGAGYMERESRRALDQIVQKLYMMRLSEDDWCMSICEAIDASRLESPHGPEISTGVSDVPFDVPNAPMWYSNPKFSSFIVRQKSAESILIGANAGDVGPDSSSTSLAETLRVCRTRREALQVVAEAFAAQLRGDLQISCSDDDLMASRGSEIGLDSLVSVDVASWFRKKLQVSVPVLKIMSNEPMAALVEYAVEQIPKEMLPSLDTESDTPPVLGPNGHQKGDTAMTTSSDERSSDEAGLIDWEAESRLPTDIVACLMSSEALPLPNKRPRVIVLTGATGLLGRHLLAHLQSHAEVTKIICLAVRRLSARLQAGELPRDDSGRIFYYGGTLSEPRLGLIKEEAVSVFAEADAVIHNGSDTSHMKSYAEMRSINVGSTTELIRLCSPRRIPVHYVSSAGVSVLYTMNWGQSKTEAEDLFQGRENRSSAHGDTLSTQPVFPKVSVAATPPTPQFASFGYMCSKWVNERLLERVAQEADSGGRPGLRVSIHRPSTILREAHTRDAEEPRAGLDWVNALLRYVRLLGAVPRIENNVVGALDLVLVKNVCDDILREVFLGGSRDGGSGGVTYVHEVGDVVVPLEGMQRCAYLLPELQENQKGDEPNRMTRKDELDVFPMRVWLDRAMAAGMHPAVAALIEAMDERGAPTYPKLLKTIRKDAF